ncbi:MAG TPA: NHLP bacteriocin system secretion protein [Phycisphaerales bacterium]|nr:NHLP bacteriocin system secretion protein [Phycisphaerales bacterium]
MEGEDHIFRERAVDSASSPESINRVAPIASARLWVLLVGAGAVVATFTAWGFFGSIPLTVRGTGILIEGSMVVAAEAPADGRIGDLLAKPGDRVEQGQVLAVVANPLLEAQRIDAQNAAARLREQDATISAAEDLATAAFTASINVRDSECRRRIDRAAAIALDFSKAVEVKRDLVRQGLLAESELLTIANATLEIERALSDARSELLRIQADRTEASIRRQQDRQRRENAISDADALIRQLAARMSAERNVIAPRPGKLVQLTRSPGDVVHKGNTVAIISDAGDGRLRCYAFFPLTEGKRVQKDMHAHVEPSIADRERFGVISSVVRDVEPVVGTRDSFLRIMNSPEVAQDIERRYGGTVSAVIDLEVDAASPTGLRWTGGVGYPKQLTPGTLCDVDVVTEDVAPISLLVPWLRQAFGGR